MLDMTGVPLRDSTFGLFAAQHYDNPNCDGVEEFEEDLRRFKYVKRLINSYVAGGELKHRLILNHIIVIYNVFGSEAATKMLFMRLRGLERYIKPFLVLMGHMPDRVCLPDRTIIGSDVTMDEEIVSALRRI